MQAEYEQDRHSRALPGSSAGPNKASHGPTGAQELGIELGGEGDARRERARALAEGDALPPLESTNIPRNPQAAYGMPNGQDLGVSTPGEEARDKMQSVRDNEFHKSGGAPDLSKIARTSQASSAHNPLHNQDNIVSTANRQPGEMLDTVGRSTGTESGTGAAGQDGAGTIEIGRDAPSGNVPQE